MSRESDSRVEEESNDETTRRRLLSTMGTAGLGVAGMSAISSQEVAAAKEAVDEVSGRERAAVLRDALGSRDVRSLFRRLVRDGYSPRFADARVLETVDERENLDYNTVSIPFEARRSDEQVVLLWTDSDHFETHARVMDHLGGTRWETTSYVTDGGRVRTESGQFDLAEADEVRAQLWCSNINWSCTLSVAGAWAGSIAACAACAADPTRITCLSCIGAVLSATGGTLGCDFCHD